MSGNEDEDNAGQEKIRSGPGGEQGAIGEGAGEAEGEQAELGKPASAVAKWGVAGLLLFYAGTGVYSVASAFGPELLQGHPVGVTRSVATPLARPAASTSDAGRAAAAAKAYAGRAYAARVAASAKVTAPSAEVLTAISATAVGPRGPGDGDNPQLAQLVLDPRSGTSWVTQWYASSRFGNLKDGTGLLLDMGRVVTVTRIQLSLAGNPGFWGADVEIRVGDTPDLASTSPAAVATDVGGWISTRLASRTEGRYVQIWFTKLPRDSWGTYQEHVYAITVHGSVPRPLTTHTASPGGGGTPAGPAGHGNGAESHGHQDRHGQGHRSGLGGGASGPGKGRGTEAETSGAKLS